MVTKYVYVIAKKGAKIKVSKPRSPLLALVSGGTYIEENGLLLRKYKSKKDAENALRDMFYKDDYEIRKIGVRVGSGSSNHQKYDLMGKVLGVVR